MKGRFHLDGEAALDRRTRQQSFEPAPDVWKAAHVVAVALGWAGVVAVPQLWDHAGAAGVALLGVGGILYTVGAVVYAARRPDPVPAVFGYHELFHALVIAAAACQYGAVAVFVLD